MLPKLWMEMPIQQPDRYRHFHFVPHPVPGRTSLRFSVELLGKWAIPTHDGFFGPREVRMGSMHQISHFSLSKETSSFYKNYSCLTRTHSSHSPRTSLPPSSIILQGRSTMALLGSARSTLPPTFWSIHEPVSARNAWRKA